MSEDTKATLAALTLLLLLFVGVAMVIGSVAFVAWVWWTKGAQYAACYMGVTWSEATRCVTQLDLLKAMQGK